MYVVCDENGISRNYRHHNGHIVMFSSIKEIESNLLCQGFSIKYVLSGKETFILRDQRFELSSQQYLLGNHHSEGKVIIDSKSNVKALCFGIKPSTFAEVLASLTGEPTGNPAKKYADFFFKDDFLETKFDVATGKLGHTLAMLGQSIQKNPHHDHDFTDEMYYRLLEGFIEDTMPLAKQNQSLHSLKPNTRRDLIRKLQQGKAFIENQFCDAIDVELMAKQANISQYHFHRLFKHVYNISPYQYLKQIRLQAAMNQLKTNKDISIQELAQNVGYSDIFSFSKAFKQRFGCPPSRLMAG